MWNLRDRSINCVNLFRLLSVPVSYSHGFRCCVTDTGVMAAETKSQEAQDVEMSESGKGPESMAQVRVATRDSTTTLAYVARCGVSSLLCFHEQTAPNEGSRGPANRRSLR